MSMIGEQRARLLGSLSDITNEGWQAPTVCVGWSVKDVVSHLVEGELAIGRIYRGEETAPGFIDLAQTIERWRALPGDAVRAALWQHGVATQRILESMDDQRWQAPIEAFGCARIGQLARLQLFEGAVHGHDITDALNLPAFWEPCLPFLAEFVVRAAPRTLGRHSFTGAPPYGIRLADRRWILDRRGGRWVLGDDGEAATATIIAEPAPLVLATTGRAADDPLAGMRIEGDATEARLLLDAWQILA